MLTKSKIILAASILLAAGSFAMAAENDDTPGGFRQLGSGGTITEGVNPADHPSLNGEKSPRQRAIENEKTEGRAPAAAVPQRAPSAGVAQDEK
jgi:hypothetical protein